MAVSNFRENSKISNYETLKDLKKRGFISKIQCPEMASWLYSYKIKSFKRASSAYSK